MQRDPDAELNKVPEVTFFFWVLKILATTLGETGGDAVTMTMNLGYLVGTAIFAVILLALVRVQLSIKRFHPFLYWAVIVATTTTGTTLADFADRSLGIGYTGGSFILLLCLISSLAAWYLVCGSISATAIRSPKTETFYWITIMFSQTLGTALGDWMADTSGFGYRGSALIFASGLGLIVFAYYYTKLSHTLLFWMAFVLTRPLGATVGDFLDKPLNEGGLALNRVYASALLAALIIAGVILIPQKAGRHTGL